MVFNLRFFVSLLIYRRFDDFRDWSSCLVLLADIFDERLDDFHDLLGRFARTGLDETCIELV